MTWSNNPDDRHKQPRWQGQKTEMIGSKQWFDHDISPILRHSGAAESYKDLAISILQKNAENSKNHGKASSRRKELQDDATFLSVFTTNVEANNDQHQHKYPQKTAQHHSVNLDLISMPQN